MGFTFLLLIISCKHDNKVDNFNVQTCLEFKVDLFKKYIEFRKSNLIKTPIDFIDTYSSFCKTKKFEKDSYTIIQAYAIIDDKYNGQKSLTYELIHFKSFRDLDISIKEIKQFNCIDAFNMKLHKIYRIGNNTAIYTNFINFDIDDFESFLKQVFDKEISIEIINIPK